MANRALLVGINAYPTAPLKGCVNDIDDVKRFLIGAHGFVEAEIRILADADATTANIRNTLTDFLLAGAAPGDRLVFHYSGHGSQLPAGNVVHDVICPVDFDFTESTALSDVDFSAIFDKLPQGVLFTWISDSCHSGDLARGLERRRALEERRPRYLPPPPALQAEIDAIRRAGGGMRSLSGPFERLRGVLLAGCRSNEESADAYIEGRYNGAFTYYLLKDLKAKSAAATLKEVIETVNKSLDAQEYMQHPQIRGMQPLAENPFLRSSPSHLADTVSATSMTPEEVDSARAGRDYGDDGGRGLEQQPTVVPRSELDAISTEKIASMISPEAHALVISEEISSRAAYERKYKHPEYPGGASGVTIGFGYDIGQLTNQDFAAAWDGLLPPHDYERLKACVHLTGGRAKEALPSVKDIVVPWDLADTSYHRYTVDKFGRLTAGAFPNALRLHPHSFGALYSLVYNRGTDMRGERRAEMRAIRDHMAAHRFDLVPGDLRAMKHIWAGSLEGLVKRREDEARLFERGLRAAAEVAKHGVSAEPPVAAAPPAPEAPPQAPAQPQAAAPAPAPTVAQIEPVPSSSTPTSEPPSNQPASVTATGSPPPPGPLGPAQPRRARSAAGGNRVALVIGNGRYTTFNSLPNALEDAKLITTTLENVGFDTIVGGAGKTKWGRPRDGENLDKAAMAALRDEFLAAVVPGGTAAIYYAGHGLQVAGSNYLVPVDAVLTTGSILDELIDLNDLVDRAVEKAGPAGHVLVFLDACRDNPLGLSAVKQWALDQERHSGKPVSAGPGLAVWNIDGSASGSAASQFIAYATAPGSTALDGTSGSKNSPFAAALGRHMGTRGLALDDCFSRVGRDVQQHTSRASRVQDPWKAANLKLPFYFKPRSWTPMAVLGVLGLAVGYLISLVILDTSCVIVSPLEHSTFWLAVPLFAALNAVGTWNWGRAEKRDARGIWTLLFAIVGAMTSIAVALAVLQLVREPAAGLTRIVNEGERLWASKFYMGLALAAGTLMSIGTYMNADRTRARLTSLFDFAAPFVLTYLLVSLGHRLFDVEKDIDIRMILISLIAGVLCAAGNALSCAPQGSVFKGFNAMVGAVTVGLILPALFDLYSTIHGGDHSTVQCSLPLARTLCALWFGMLGAELGYCFAYYVPEHEPVKPMPRVPVA